MSDSPLLKSQRSIIPCLRVFRSFITVVFLFPLTYIPVAHSLVKEIDVFEYEAEERGHPLLPLLPSAGLADATLQRLTIAGEILYRIYKFLERERGERERERERERGREGER